MQVLRKPYFSSGQLFLVLCFVFLHITFCPQHNRNLLFEHETSYYLVDKEMWRRWDILARTLDTQVYYDFKYKTFLLCLSVHCLLLKLYIVGSYIFIFSRLLSILSQLRQYKIMIKTIPCFTFYSAIYFSLNIEYNVKSVRMSDQFRYYSYYQYLICLKRDALQLSIIDML